MNNDFQIFSIFAEIMLKSVIFRRDFHRNLPEFSEIADIRRNSIGFNS